MFEEYNMLAPPDKRRTCISRATAWRWMHNLGFSYMGYKKGVYFDGHEDPAVIADRNLKTKLLREYMLKGYNYIHRQGSKRHDSELQVNRFNNG